MNQDPILKELRQIRQEIEAETNHDPKQYHAYLLQVQERHKERIQNVAGNSKHRIRV